jgi:hypothetical protein
MKRRDLLISGMALTSVPLLSKPAASGGPGGPIYLPIAFVNAEDAYERATLFVSFCMSPPNPGDMPEKNVVRVSVDQAYVDGTPFRDIEAYGGYYYTSFPLASVGVMQTTLITVTAHEGKSNNNVGSTKTDGASILNSPYPP